ncbi:hypothetical protein Mapa_007559 [Marchantia paleacea]|nr:hypothetical protein Mapa_007559 [Marchantia paleacea]
MLSCCFRVHKNQFCRSPISKILVTLRTRSDPCPVRSAVVQHIERTSTILDRTTNEAQSCKQQFDFLQQKC